MISFEPCIESYFRSTPRTKFGKSFNISSLLNLSGRYKPWVQRTSSRPPSPPPTVNLLSWIQCAHFNRYKTNYQIWLSSFFVTSELNLSQTKLMHVFNYFFLILTHGMGQFNTVCPFQDGRFDFSSLFDIKLINCSSKSIVNITNQRYKYHTLINREFLIDTV